MRPLGFGNKWFECSISATSTTFKGGLPPIKPHLRQLGNEGYIGKKILDLNKRYERPYTDLMNSVDSYKLRSSQLIALYDDMMTDYDREILATTCALSYWKGCHTDLDASGGPGAFNDFSTPDDVIAAVVDYYNQVKQIPDDKISTSMVRGKNVGYPHPISGMQRELNLALYAVHASLASKSYNGGLSLKEVTKQLESYHGTAYAIYGERSQHTGKEQPMIMREGFFYSKNFEMRKRGILMVPKYVIMHNRKGVQHAKWKILNSKIHNQSRPDLVKDIGWALANFEVHSADWPKFDYTFGGRSGRTILKIIAGISDKTLSMDDLLLEFEMPLLYFGHKGAYLDSSAPQLPSGASFTSLMGCTANFSTIVWAISRVKKISPKEVISLIDKKWFLRCWGDDTVVGVKPDWLTHDTLFKEINSIIKKEMDIEPVIKYLGDVYAPDMIKDVSLGYQLSRWIQQQEFPERDKDFPFSTIGYIARLDKLNPALQKEVHRRYHSLWRPEKLGPYFNFEDRHAIMESCVKQIEKYASKISQIDDILQFMTHGNDDSFYDDSSLDSSFIKSLLGVVSVDVADPQSIIAKGDKYGGLRSALDVFAQKGFSSYTSILTALRTDFNLSYQRGDLVY